MNIFALDHDPNTAATYHCDKHVIKMILETAQLLSTAVHTHATHVHRELADVGYAYKPTHRNHPCAVWARETRGNFEWLCELGFALVQEHVLRYAPKRTHKSLNVIGFLSARGACRMPSGACTPFAQAMPPQYKGTDSVIAYHRYYAGEKRLIATYRAPRSFPSFMPQQDTNR